MSMAASVMTSGTLLMQVWCADSWDSTNHKVMLTNKVFVMFYNAVAWKVFIDS